MAKISGSQRSFRKCQFSQYFATIEEELWNHLTFTKNYRVEPLSDFCICLVKSRQNKAFVSPHCLSLFTQIGALFPNKPTVLHHFLTTIHSRFNITCVMYNTMFKPLQLGMCLTLGIFQKKEKKYRSTYKISNNIDSNMIFGKTENNSLWHNNQIHEVLTCPAWIWPQLKLLIILPPPPFVLNWCKKRYIHMIWCLSCKL